MVIQSQTVLKGYQSLEISEPLWLSILRLLFSLLRPAAVAVSEDYRKMFDAEHAKAFPGEELPAVNLVVPEFEHFVADMEDVRHQMSKADTSDYEVVNASLRVARTAENSGRLTIRRAVDELTQKYIDKGFSESDARAFAADDERRRVRGSTMPQGRIIGWARVPTGKETCGFCWMLASRGPVYGSAESGGAKHVSGDPVAADYTGGWHTGCDCKVVPVFNLDDWQGRNRYLAAEELWKESTVGFHGKEAVNAFRRAVERGELENYL